MKKKSVAFYIINDFGEFEKIVTKSALTRSKKRKSMEPGSVNYCTARPISELEDDAEGET